MKNKRRAVIIIGGVFIIALITCGVLLAVFNRPHQEGTETTDSTETVEATAESDFPEAPAIDPVPVETPAPAVAPEPEPIAAATTSLDDPTSNCTLKLNNLMLINPNFTVSANFIAQRRTELISLAQTYGIPEHHAYNGDNLLDATAAAHLNEMLLAYSAEYPGHSMGTMSCFRSVGTSCGRLCLATGTSEHHSGFTCDLIDTAYGYSLDTDLYDQHLEWQWLHANSYKYGFIDRYPLEWAGSSMSEPMNLTADGTTGLYETWHYRYVGIPAATDIALGRYNNGNYDSLEHYLLMTGRVKNLLNATCD